jgi:voltage-gated potassium channel
LEGENAAGGQILAFVLMHLSIFVVAPFIAVRLVDRLNEDRDAFTNEEQVQIVEGIARIKLRQRLEDKH